MADVKFSELTSLAGTALASDDIFAVVDTSATTSKKLTVDNLFASVPVNIGQSDATDATSAEGAIRTAGGVSMAKKLYVGTTSTLVGKVSTENMSLDMGTAAAATTTTITSAASGTAKTLTLPNATDTLVGKATTDTFTNKTFDVDGTGNSLTNIANANIKASAAIADSKLATISTAGKVDVAALEIDGATDIGEALADADLIVVDNGAGGTNRKAAMSRIGTYIAGSTLTLTNKTLTTPVIASLQQASGTNTLTMPAATDTLVGKATTDILTNKTLSSALVTTKLQASANDGDVTFNQYDATEVARIHDGYNVPTAAGTSTSLSAGTGFGFRRRVLTLGSGNDDNTLTLTAADCGSIIYVTPTNAVALILPLVGTETGQWFDIIFAANVNKTFSLKTSGQDGADNITLHCVASDAVAVDVGAADHDVLTITNAQVGTRIQVINAAGGSAEKWHAYVASMDTVDAAIA